MLVPHCLLFHEVGINVFSKSLERCGCSFLLWNNPGSLGPVRKFSSCSSLFKGLLLSSSGAKCQWLLLMKPNPPQFCVIWGFASPTPGSSWIHSVFFIFQVTSEHFVILKLTYGEKQNKLFHVISPSLYVFGMIRLYMPPSSLLAPEW